jgi:hypothetical protein
MRAALAAAVATLGALLFAAPASAGGPTSVLLVVPGAGRTASLYYDDAEYQELSALVGAEGPVDVGTAEGTSGPGHENGPGVTLTWLIHDVTVWRVDRVYPGADDTMWISTQAADLSSSSIWDSPVVWHPAANSKRLLVLLDRLGVNPVGGAAVRDVATDPIGGSDPAGSVAADAGSSAAPAATAAAGRSATASRSDTWMPLPAGPVWGFAGLALGVLATLTGRRWTAGRRRSAPGSDQVGADGDVESEPVTDADAADAAPDLAAIRDRDTTRGIDPDLRLGPDPDGGGGLTRGSERAGDPEADRDRDFGPASRRAREELSLGVER